ncbi:MAG: UDP-3-O-(3-hydroxymyristoyl)glucosamine N-acyltransferase [Variovorax sp.]
MSLTLGAIAEALGGELHGDPTLAIERLAPITSATPDSLTFIAHRKFTAALAGSRAGCIVVAPALSEAAATRGAYITTPDPYLYFARLTQLWKQHHASLLGPRIHPSAVIDPDSVIDPSARIGALCVVERGVRIGEDSVLLARVTLLEGCSVGKRCLIHPGAVIGADGFGIAPSEGHWVKIEQLGAVRIGDDVEIGANTCIDRGALEDTVIEDGVKLDNLIQIGHNVRIGKHTAIAACAGVAGSAVIGAHCMIGGAALIWGHTVMGDHVRISAGSAVTRSLARPGEYSGIFPIDDNAAWAKNAATLRQLHGLRDRVRALEMATPREKNQ